MDATINNKDQVASLGVVIKDSNGNIVSAGIKQAHLKKDISFAEAEAIEWGLEVVRTANWSSLTMETDCKDAADILNNTKDSRTSISWVITKIQNKKKDFKEVKLRHIP